MSPLQLLLNRWAQEDVGALPGVEASTVRASFARIGAMATEDVVELYGAIGGMEKMDSEYWRHWPLAEVEAENKTPSPYGVLFADYLVSSWCYRLKATHDKASCVYVDFFDGNEPTLVATSLNDFLSLYLRHPDSALFGPAPRGDA